MLEFHALWWLPRSKKFVHFSSPVVPKDSIKFVIATYNLVHYRGSSTLPESKIEV